jgi:membrane protein
MGIINYVKRTFSSFLDDDCMTMGAAIAYYTVFSLAPLLLTVIAIAGLVFGREAVQHGIVGQIQQLIGSDAAKEIQTMLAKAGQNHTGGIIGTIIGLIILIFGATGAFSALQDALDRAWHVKPDPKTGGLRSFVTKRVLSFGMILGVVFLLIVSLAISAMLAAVGSWMQPMLPAGLSEGVLHGITFVVSFVVISALFAAMFRVLPDAHVAWRDVWLGGAVTGVLFDVGKTAIGLYLGKAAPASTYGAAGSFVVIVLWLYYASLIVLLGAEFTKIWADAHGRGLQPQKGAVRVEMHEQLA